VWRRRCVDDDFDDDHVGIDFGEDVSAMSEKASLVTTMVSM
jgi:hypothetical protein